MEKEDKDDQEGAPPRDSKEGYESDNEEEEDAPGEGEGGLTGVSLDASASADQEADGQIGLGSSERTSQQLAASTDIGEGYKTFSCL